MVRRRKLDLHLLNDVEDPWWTDLTDDELLNQRLCDLDLQLLGSWVERAFHRLKKELARKGLHDLDTRLWISTDWFCPDGHNGFAVPFFLLHPRLALLEEQAVGEAEGGNWDWCLKLMRHEMGHVLENAFPEIPRSRDRQNLFGSNAIAYPRAYSPRLYSRSFVHHLGAGYAQAHPAEDFAETFAVWLAPGSNWRDRYRGKALAKLEGIERLIEEHARYGEVRGYRRRYEPIDRDRRTLKQFYAERVRKLHNRIQSTETVHSLDRQLQRLVREEGNRSRPGRNMPGLRSLWQVERDQIAHNLAVEFRAPKYRVRSSLLGMDACLRELGERPVQCPINATEELYRLARRQYRQYHKARGYNIPI